MGNSISYGSYGSDGSHGSDGDKQTLDGGTCTANGSLLQISTPLVHGQKGDLVLDIQDQLSVRPDHISGVGPIVHPASLKNDVRIFDVYLIGGQTITIRVSERAAAAARAAVIKAVDELP